MTFIQIIKRTVEISRPVFWPSTFFAFILGVLFSHYTLSSGLLLYAFLWSFPYSLWICTVNDLADTDTDELNVNKGGISGAKISTKEYRFIKKLQWISLFVIIFPIISTNNYILIIVSIAALAIPYIYSTYPIRMKERPPLDSLCNGGFVACVFLAGYVFSYPIRFDSLFYEAFFAFILEFQQSIS
ncbi:hypothetical protein BH09PAT2_BH09PAT2_10390 [soil metagenome]